MGRPRIGKTVMTPAERQRRRRAKLAEIIDPERVIADLDRVYQRAFPADQDAIRTRTAALGAAGRQQGVVAQAIAPVTNGPRNYLYWQRWGEFATRELDDRELAR
jgi:hypothetical protein